MTVLEDTLRANANEVFWERLSAERLRYLAERDAIVLVPIGSTEQHGPHLPTGVDSILSTEVCRRTAELVAKQQPIVVAPTVWCGLADHHVSFGGTFSLRLSTFHALLHDLCRSILTAGFRRIVLVNGHGGNMAGLSALQQELTRELGIPVATTTYFMECLPEIAAVLDDQNCIMHACEGETSMMMAIASEFVDRTRLDEATGPHFDIVGSLRPSLKRSRSFHDVTSSGVAGVARRASGAKGLAILGAAASTLARKLVSGEPWRTSATE
ncbi:creatininase family protein [Bradyrhizobium sp. BR 10289]|uniref:creatininase family protein n=1 Tax=Bradyrhizobium sp. BR 10289 TaxID=2749993 RepID=UPI001C64D5BC|nr:creatininase family protein [Bradyrhizobium sp. BR 10289]MBW7970197.1 creatininase family protein [Bradyrhizobium sp. BR 10289]